MQLCDRQGEEDMTATRTLFKREDSTCSRLLTLSFLFFFYFDISIGLSYHQRNPCWTDLVWIRIIIVIVFIFLSDVHSDKHLFRIERREKRVVLAWPSLKPEFKKDLEALKEDSALAFSASFAIGPGKKTQGKNAKKVEREKEQWLSTLSLFFFFFSSFLTPPLLL